jgi:hypothetical protein
MERKEKRRKAGARPAKKEDQQARQKVEKLT